MTEVLDRRDLSAVTTVHDIRRHFPALERIHQGRPVAYFDGPGGTQVPRVVVDAMAAYLYQHNANTHWHYPSSHETDAAIEAARGALADFLGTSPAEVAFGANMTTLTFHLGRALGRSWGRGDEVVVTELDHHANVDTWAALERDRGITLRRARMDPETGRLDLDDLAGAITSRTKLVAVGAASNALGTVSDVAAAVRLAHDAGSLAFVDAVHYAAHGLVDVGALGCDFLACSAYKFYGPHVGVLYARRSVLEALDVPKLVPAPDAAPERIETGTLNHEGIVGAGAAVDFLASLAPNSPRREALAAVFDALHARGTHLVDRLWRGLSAVPGVRLYGPPPGEPRTPTVAFTVEGVPASGVAKGLARRAVFVSDGNFYALTVMKRLGVDEGVVRAGCACYTTEEEVDRLIEGVREITETGH
jgi:cysteine desulfurase family protein (TIGR01976 family)